MMLLVKMPFKKSGFSFYQTMQNYHVKKKFLVITVNIDKTLDKIKNVEFIYFLSQHYIFIK